MSDSEVLIRAEHVSKKFCRSLKRSLWYGAQDVANSLMPWKRSAVIEDANKSREFPMPTLRQDEFWALNDVSFEVRRGECLGLIGHNGAGKSTLLKMLNSLIRLDSGKISMRGRVGALIELNAGFNSILSGRENIYNQAALLGFSKKEIDAKFDEIVDFSELEQFLDTPVQNYSSGMKVRLGFAIATQLELDILLIDEILAVGDVGFRFKCINKMAELMSRSAVIFVSHTMPQVLRVCSDVMHLEYGEVSYLGSDVSKGVDSYYQKLPLQTETILGTGGVTLESVRLRSPRSTAQFGEPLELEYGETLEFEMVLQMNSEINRAVVQVLIWNKDMLAVLDVIGPELKGFLVENNAHGKHLIKLNLENIALNSGLHFLSVLVSAPDFSVQYLRQDNAAVLRMMTRTASGASTVTDGHWQFEGTR